MRNSSGFGDYLLIYLTHHYKLRNIPLVNKIKSLIVMRSMKPSHEKKNQMKEIVYNSYCFHSSIVN